MPDVPFSNPMYDKSVTEKLIQNLLGVQDGFIRSFAYVVDGYSSIVIPSLEYKTMHYNTI